MLTSWTEIQTTLKTRDIVLSADARLLQDSRAIATGDVFVAIKGLSQDGSAYISKAIQSGASLVLVSDKCDPALYQDVKDFEGLLVVNDLELRLPELAKDFYQQSNNELALVGITGTNGKTSISHLLGQLCKLACNKENAVIGTMGTGQIDHLVPSSNTTPGVTDVYRLLRDFSRDPNHEFVSVAMEVSSHALEQHRVKGLNFDVAVFTNLTLDHLDYHGTMENYFAAKAKLFTDYLPKNAVINVDDDYGRRLVDLVSEATRVVVYGQSEEVKAYSDYVFIKSFQGHLQGLELQLDWQIDGSKESIHLQLPIYGEFNCSNLAAVFATALVLGWPVQAHHFSQIKPVPGRLELFVETDLPVAVVDYAHTPDALQQSLIAVKQHLQGQLYLVFGCGGDRDRSKRPEMAKIAEQLADHIVVTNDNPRTENENDIAKDIVAGFSDNAVFEVILERKQAIRYALNAASKEDVVLIAGKGHETYQVIGRDIIDYDERIYTRSVLSELASVQSGQGEPQ